MTDLSAGDQRKARTGRSERLTAARAAQKEACRAWDEAARVRDEADRAQDEACRAWDEADRVRDEADRAEDKAYRAWFEADRARDEANNRIRTIEAEP